MAGDLQEKRKIKKYRNEKESELGHKGEVGVVKVSKAIDKI